MVIGNKEIKPGTTQVIKDNLKAINSLRLITESDCPEETRQWNSLLVRVAARCIDVCGAFGIKYR